MQIGDKNVIFESKSYVNDVTGYYQIIICLVYTQNLN